MNSSMIDLVQYFSDTLSGPDGIYIYTFFVLLCGVFTGFFVCFCLTVLDQIHSYVSPFFKRKLKALKNKNTHHSE